MAAEPAMVSDDELRNAVESWCGATASLSYVSRVRVLEGGIPWEGKVHVFDLAGHPEARRAYAWTAADGTVWDGYLRFALDAGAIQSPVDAIRAELIKEAPGPAASQPSAARQG